MTFATTSPTIRQSLAERGYEQPTPVQQAVIDPDLRERDLLVSAQTGSGKTVAFGLAVAATLLGERERFENPGAPLALIVAPTRELALQVERELGWLYAPTGARIVSCVGGMDARREARALSQGCHIVIGTPGRLRDHVERGNLDPSSLKALVLDEADEMLDLGFREDLEAIMDATPSSRRTLLFSATMPPEIEALAEQYQHEAVRIAVGTEGEPHGDIAYRAVIIAPRETERAVVNILRYFEAPGALVFCSTREAVRRLHANLLERGFAVVALSGELSQSERNHALQALRDRRARVCVATDVAARGIDLPDLGLVIQAELPRDRETLLHRSGRTGRAGRKGTCVLLVPFSRRRALERVLALSGIDAEWSGPPSADRIRERDQERLMADVVQAEEPSEEDRTAIAALLAERSPDELAAALVRLYRAGLPAPEELGFESLRPDRPDESRAQAREKAPDRTPDRRAARPDMAGSAWFRMNVGRRAKADPRWLVPVICRRGGIDKQDIGNIRIFDRETRFEVAERAAVLFAENIRKPDPQDPNIRIEPMNSGFEAEAPSRSKAPRKEPRQGPDGRHRAERPLKPAAKKERKRPRAGGDAPLRRRPQG